MLDKAIDELPLPPDARILDAGCGSGRNMIELARRGTVTGVELSSTSVGLARSRRLIVATAACRRGPAPRRPRRVAGAL